METTNKDAPLVLLAGGKGTRISALFPDIPKPLIPVAGQPFIEWVIRFFSTQGFKSICVSLGYKAEVAEVFLDERQPIANEKVSYVRESVPLGTGGGLFYALSRLKGPSRDLVFVANADSLVLSSLDGLRGALQNPAIDGAVAGLEVEDTSRFGSLEITDDAMLRGFREKIPGRGVINAGIYGFRLRCLQHSSLKGHFSLESDLLPDLVMQKNLKFVKVQGPFIDIGTPESCTEAGHFIETSGRSFFG